MQAEFEKILIIQTASIGDVILSTALLESLHQRFPEAKLDLLVKKGMESLFIQHPYLHQLRIWDKNQKKYRQLFRMISQIRKEKYDAVINLQRFFSSGVITAFSGARITCGFKKNPMSRYFKKTFEHKIGDGTHEIERNFQQIAWINGTQLMNPRLYPGDHLHENISHHTKDDFITISPASLWYTKQFPRQQWISFLKEIPQDIKVIFLGGKADQSTCREIIDEIPEIVTENLAGQLNLLESAALMHEARMNFVNDSAPLHLASSVNAPVAAVFCSTIPDFGFGPLSDQSYIIETKTKLRCRPCGLHGYKACPEKHFRCAKTIQPDQLLTLI